MIRQPVDPSMVAIPIDSESCWQDPEPNDAWAYGDYSAALHPSDWKDGGISDPFTDRFEPAF